MLVRDLIAKLQTMPQHAVVVLSRDSEGNGYSPLADAEKGRYTPDNSYMGERDDTGGEQTAVFLWPTN